jgi:AGCS family alanine or glycine:cation symporter
MDQVINSWFEPMVKWLQPILFWDPVGEHGIVNLGLEAQMPFVVLWLLIGGLFFTLYLGFINLRGFGHALSVVRGGYSKSSDPGELTHFQTLSTALSGTVGLGNIAGVAVAMSLGGPGATFWMILAGFLGMSLKFAECTMGVKYRKLDRSGRVFGGPMHYLRDGLAKRGPVLAGLGKFLAILFALLCVAGSLGGGNMFQANQAFQLSATEFNFLQEKGFFFGLFLAFLVGLVIFGGVKRIAQVAKRLVPLMCVVYIGMATVIVFAHLDRIDEAFKAIVGGAFSPDSIKGGVIGVLILGITRAAFSSEAGVGSAAIAHSAVRSKEPVSEGTVALLEPFIDTVVVCTMTAMVLIFTGYAAGHTEVAGVELTSAAFASVVPWFKWLLLFIVWCFSFSTILVWAYYGLQSWNYLFGRFSGRPSVEMSYKILVLFCVVVGSASSLGAVLDFANMTIICMSLPNLIGLMLMSKEVRTEMLGYYQRLRENRIIRYV